jgi:hypothetical protein
MAIVHPGDVISARAKSIALIDALAGEVLLD